MLVELTLDAPQVSEIDALQRTKARGELARWLAGDHTSNNNYRGHGA